MASRCLPVLLLSGWCLLGLKAQCTSPLSCDVDQYTPGTSVEGLYYSVRQSILSELRQESTQNDRISQATSEATERLQTRITRMEAEVTEKLSNMEETLENTTRTVERLYRSVFGRPRDCTDMASPVSGVYNIYPRIEDESLPMFFRGASHQVYCDAATAPGGWTVFQRRVDGSVNFNRSWTEYKDGFGNLAGEYWLGNEMLHLLTTGRNYKLRVELMDFDNISVYAEYSRFQVDSESNNYRLTVSGYTGTAGDSLRTHNGLTFSTHDRDTSRRNCPRTFNSGGWFGHCFRANLNGQYHNEAELLLNETYHGVHWLDFRSSSYSLSFAELKIRPH